MTRIPENDRDLIEQAIYLPMIVIILERDLQIIEKAPFKINRPYHCQILFHNKENELNRNLPTLTVLLIS
ncbi:hypothetical protein [Cytobacillus horneckiae]|uniref:hypothetical protein n=1 Tax=Cytobacillus horneckiae TaxID=549687 RepID=UPI00203EB402|nr:hypothetical protein [Cytobacillus horneckiae]MCM3180867.1 hypothetical protein [Cytobacillus horneckiae]